MGIILLCFHLSAVFNVNNIQSDFWKLSLSMTIPTNQDTYIFQKLIASPEVVALFDNMTIDI